MSDPTFELAESEAVEPADFADAFDDWIGGATLSKRAVTVYGKPGLAAEFEALQAELETLPDEGESSLSEGGGRRAEIDARLTDLHDEWLASKSVWIVEDVSSVIAEIREATGEKPEEPEPLDEPFLRPNSSEQQKRIHNVQMQAYLKAKPEHDAKVHAYEKAMEVWHADYALNLVARATVEIRFSDGRKSGGVTVDQLRQMRERLGELQLLRLNEAAQRAMMEEPVIEAPFSPSTSEPDPT